MSRVLPILFNTDMIRSILNEKKAVIRQVIKHPYYVQGDKNDKRTLITVRTAPKGSKLERLIGSMPYPDDRYKIGDILYVRETIWQKTGHYLDIDGETKAVFLNEFRYVATDEKPEVGWNYSWVKRPSIHMPKEAARLFLKVTDVRVDRLQDITEEQAEEEGCSAGYGNAITSGPFGIDDDPDEWTAREEFEDIWNSTIKKSDLACYGWDANPWVWVIEFEQCEKPEEVQNE